MKLFDQKHWHHLTAALLFILSSILYLRTMAPTVSLWDCGEFISCAVRLEVGHPPGAPLYLLLARFFTLFATDVSTISWWSNLVSVVASAATITLLYSIIVHIIRYSWPEYAKSYALVSLPAAIGALLFAVSDTFWFSAVESEVYALSMFFTAVTFWSVLRWDKDFINNRNGIRWLALASYLTGLSIGVHLLNLLTIPVLIMLVWFRTRKHTWIELINSLAVGFSILAIILFLFVQNGLWLAGKLELLMVNLWGLPLQTGLIVFVALLFGTLFFALFKTRSKNNLTHFIWLSLLLFFMGYGSYALIIIRANAGTAINLNDPSTVFTFDSFLNREQYGNRPLIYGAYYNANPIELKTKIAHRPDGKRYESFNKLTSYTYEKENSGFFPRMFSQQPLHIHGYSYWGGVDANSPEKPTFFQNMRFFVRYQLDFMYMRYFMWNFAGRQNDNQGMGDIMDGNWISGIQPLDAMRLGNRTTLHPGESGNLSRNTYYLLPLIFGIVGIMTMYGRKADAHQYLKVIAMLFLMTGPAIVIYLNQTPFEPRERDYAFVGSFFAFSIFIGIGVFALMHYIIRFHKIKMGTYLAGAVAFLALPMLMLAQNFNDHDRSTRHFDLNMARSYLESCEPNAILFTYGDNDTYPLWYAQEVEGIRTDIRVVNYGLMGADWCIRQLEQKVNDAEPIAFSIPMERYKEGNLDNALMLTQTTESIHIASLVEFIGNNSNESKIQLQNGQMIDYSPSQNIFVPISDNDTIRWRINKEVLYKNDIAFLDLLSSNATKRPIYFTTGGDSQIFLGLDKYLVDKGLVLKLMGKENSDTLNATTISNYHVFMQNINLGDGTTSYYDHFVRRTFDVMEYRTKANTLAHRLILINEKDKARQVIKKSLIALPLEKHPTTEGSIDVIELLHLTGDDDKAAEAADLLTSIHLQSINFYVSHFHKGDDYGVASEIKNGEKLQNTLNKSGLQAYSLMIQQAYAEIGLK